MARDRESVTARSVARAAGVSVATVSRVMSGSNKVSPTRRKRVLAVAAELDYQPSTAARILATGTTHMVGLVVPNLSNPYFNDVIRGFGLASAEDGYRMVVSDSMEDPKTERSLIEELLRYVDALVILAPRANLADIARLNGADKPVVVLIGPRPAKEFPDITVDNFGGMADIYRHLADLGHRRVTYLAGPPHSSQDAVRVSAREEAVALGIEVTVLPAGGSIASGYEVTEAALATGATAFACFNDLVAFGVSRALTHRGARVPGDISVTGFDDIEFSAYSEPRLTTVRTPRADLGRHGWSALRAAIGGDRAGAQQPLPTELIVRESTGPVVD